jgi:folate-binding protein YgfZ
VSAVDWKSEYDALATTGGGVTLRGWSQVQLTGNDRVKFLHNMCTNDIHRLAAGQTCEAFCTDVKGKILAHVLVVADSDRLTLLTVPGQADSIIKHLDRYIIREDVQLADVSHDSEWHLMVGPLAEKSDGSPGATCNILWPGGSLVRTGNSQTSGLGDFPISGVESPAWTALRVESFFPLYGVDFDESNLPQEINRDAQAISFTKGCYLGQETVARIDALGHVNKMLVLLKFDGERIPESGAKLTAGGNEVGTVTTATWSPRFEAPLAIAFVRRGSNAIGNRLEGESGHAEVVSPVSGIK